MTLMSRNTLAAAVAAVLALGATVATAEAQDSATANQGQETGQVSDSSMRSDTSAYSGYQNQGVDTSADTSARTDSAQRHMPKMPQQGGPVDTSGFAKYKETMGKDSNAAANDTSSGTSTNWSGARDSSAWKSGDSSSADSSAGQK
jgi:hypothetical protein